MEKLKRAGYIPVTYLQETYAVLEQHESVAYDAFVEFAAFAEAVAMGIVLE